MLNIKEVNYFTKLVNKKLADPVQCPFEKFDENHLVISGLDDNDEVYFKCLNCNNRFKSGYNLEKRIKDTIDKYKSIR
jgi:hypothetical protein